MSNGSNYPFDNPKIGLSKTEWASFPGHFGLSICILNSSFQTLHKLFKVSLIIIYICSYTDGVAPD